jgi:four helix bundle protein
MDKKDLEIRTKEFAIRIIKFIAPLPKNRITAELGHQLLRSGTSVGADYREARRAESRRDFIHKLGIIEKECSESQYWLELFDSLDLGSRNDRQWLLREAGELLAIFTSSGRTAKRNRNSVSDYLIESYETV